MGSLKNHPFENSFQNMWEHIITGICTGIISSITSTLIICYFLKKTPFEVKEVENDSALEDVESPSEEGMKMREMIAHETMKILIDTNVMNTVQNTCTTSSPVVILSQLNEFPYSIYGTLPVEIPEKGVKHV